MLLMGEAHWHWFHGRAGEALEACRRAYEMVRRNLAFNHLTAATLPYLVTALRRHGEACALSGSRQHGHLRARTFRLAKWAIRLARLMPLYQPHALRELSLCHAARGRFREALRLAERSCAVALGQQARYDHAESLLVRARLAHRLGLPGAEEQVHTAEAALAGFTAAIRTATRPHAGAGDRDEV
jgi:hypothetical protein